ncbi:NAD(P)H:quinone oxidoreductase [Fulvivirga kasyanovii]|uniref:SDR family oxidoreductase n=1 Tax=Fulvivirga kasyanovii TaxID=396812 RepID=A0ABW9RYL0_9BACT|nr:SDR family oxidoreductase [Fulvivirga kasyanovii]MTI28811.1 SDR family oxidoreductase [Fulvivirga kasyanovii]
MILITGASGHLGGLVIENLLKAVPASQIAAMVRNAEKASDLKAKGVDVRIGDYHNRASMEAAFKGVDKLLLISSNDFNDRLQQHKNAIDAAKNAGVKHIFYTGVAIKDINASPLKPLLADHFQTEDYIRENGFTYTFLRNTLYFEVTPMFMGEQVLDNGVYFPAGDGKVAFATRADLAEATALLLSGKGIENKTFNLTGSEAVSFADIAQELSALSGKEVAYNSPDPKEFEATLKQFGLPEGIVQMSVLFAAGMKNNDFENTDDTLEDILGRKPKTLPDFLKATYGNH